ncbi:MAG: hypothetical protein ABI759_12190 [Candidatus Solibacter sp.]
MAARRSIIVVVVLGAVRILAAHDVITTKITWSREISRIVYKQCAPCHDGNPAFSLLAYAEARPWAKAIKDEVLARRMPPWNAVKGFGEFKNDHGLSQDDLAVISEWVDGGAPEGNPLALPPRPVGEENEAGKTPAGQNVNFTGSMVLQAAVAIIGIQVAEFPGGAVQIFATRPDGTIEPLIWLQNFSPTYNRPYYFRNALRFPAGTQVNITPPTASGALIVQSPPPKAKSAATSTPKRAR